MAQKDKYASSSSHELSFDSSQFDEDDHLPLLTWKENNNAAGSSLQSATQSDEIQCVRVIKKKLSYEFMPAFRYNSNVLFCPEEQQFYCRNSCSKMREYYACQVKTCKCRVHMRNNECYIGNAMVHNHEKKTDMYHNLCALNEMKRILSSVDNQFSAKKVFDDVIKRHPKCTLVYGDHDRTLQIIRKSCKSKNVAKEKRVSSTKISDNEGVANKKTKRTAISPFDMPFQDEAMQNSDFIETPKRMKCSDASGAAPESLKANKKGHRNQLMTESSHLDLSANEALKIVQDKSAEFLEFSIDVAIDDALHGTELIVDHPSPLLDSTEIPTMIQIESATSVQTPSSSNENLKTNEQNPVASKEVLDLSIELVTASAVLPPRPRDSGLENALPALPFNSTEDSIVIRMTKQANDLRNCGGSGQMATKSSCNNGTLVASTRDSISSYDKFENGKENHDDHMSSTSLAPQTTSASKGDAFKCQVYMREEDLNRLMQSGRIFIDQGRFHYK